MGRAAWSNHWQHGTIIDDQLAAMPTGRSWALRPGSSLPGGWNTSGCLDLCTTWSGGTQAYVPTPPTSEEFKQEHQARCLEQQHRQHRQPWKNAPLPGSRPACRPWSGWPGTAAQCPPPAVVKAYCALSWVTGGCLRCLKINGTGYRGCTALSGECSPGGAVVLRLAVEARQLAPLGAERK